MKFDISIIIKDLAEASKIEKLLKDNMYSFSIIGISPEPVEAV